VDHEADLETIAGRIIQALDYVIEYLSEGIAKECARCAEDGIDPASDSATFAANVRRHVVNQMRKHLPLPARAAMSPLHLDLGPYRLKILHADEGGVPHPRTKARKDFYRLNGLGITSMNVIPVGSLVEISEDVTEILDGSLVLIWDYYGTDLTQAEMYRPLLAGFPGPSLDLLTATETITEDDILSVRKDERAPLTGTGTDGASDQERS
jgi:hypothetical protein